MALFRQHLADHPELVAAARQQLAGKVLACKCPIGEPCHGARDDPPIPPDLMIRNWP